VTKQQILQRFHLQQVDIRIRYEKRDTGFKEGMGPQIGRHKFLVGLAYIDLLAGTITVYNKKHLKNVGPIRHCEPPHAALPFTRCRYCRVARRLRIDVYNDDDDDDNDNA